ncbi:Fe-S cluster assembly protein HesB [Microbacterium sp. SD291]|uniref:Fe-S cluster assembly protein HesB n=1 Tax=Microbacterium sp. SD291 TaxID=2782007 RepID=UPI001A973ECE|nr:Fe-S cluster assembly protein HesB [Microbacterium sp. SD291]MBO0979300.1 Fe-S cluster assembly protein HesB [Microbacterium sp. SD291]
MLTLTDNATAIVTTLVNRQSDAVDAGLRIHTAAAEEPDGASRFSVLVAEHPEPQDQVLELAGARVFLEEAAAIALDDKVLDAGVDDQGAVSFAVLPQVA